MNDKTSFERYVIEAFDREGPGRPVPDAIHDELITRAGRQRQRPVWLAYVKEPPMRLTNSLAVGSPTVRVLATMAATLLLIAAMAVAGIAGKSLLAADGTLVVDPEGNGDYATITEAVAAAQDGDTVLLKPGTYPEAVTVTSAITIESDEPGTAIVEVAVGCTTDTQTFETTCPPGVPMLEGETNGPYGFLLEGADVTIEGVHFHFGALAQGVFVDGGTVTLDGLSHSVDDIGGLMVSVDGGARVTITDSDLGWGWVAPGRTSSVVLEGNTIGVVIAESNNEAEPNIIRNNVIRGQIWSAGGTVIEGNEFPPIPDRTTDDSFILIQGGSDWVVRDNVIVGATGTFAALDVQGGAGPGTIEGNTFTDNEIAIVASNDSVIRNNTIRDGRIGMRISGGAPQLQGNTVEDMEDYGVNVAFSDALLTDNRLCGSTIDLFIGTAADPVVDDSNDICVTDAVE